MRWAAAGDGKAALPNVDATRRTAGSKAIVHREPRGRAFIWCLLSALGMQD